MYKYLFFTCVFLTFLSLSAKAQNDNSLITLEEIYEKETYRQKSFGPVRWMKDNRGYSTLEDNPEYGEKDIVRYSVPDGDRRVLVSAEQLIPEGGDTPLKIADYEWSHDNEKLLIFTNTRRVWRYHTRGDYWVLDIQSGELMQLGKSVERTTMKFAKFSPDDSRVAYVSKRNIYVEHLDTGQIRQITHDGGDDIINGTFDWVYEEELSLRDGFRWSPDGQHIAYWQSNTQGVGTFYMINNIDSVYSQPIPLPYPKVGTTNPAVKIGVVAADGGQPRWFDIPGDPRNNYLARMDFVPNTNQVMIQQLNRLQNRNRVWIADILTMEFENIMTERDDAFLDIHDDTIWMDDNQYFTWTSERDGWRHLYKISKDGSDAKLITRGEFDIVNVVQIDKENNYVYYIATKEDYTERYLYRSSLSGNEDPERITPAASEGQHAYQMTANSKWAIHTYQNRNTPNRISLISLPDHRKVRVLEGNEELKQKVDALNINYKEFFRIDIGEVILDAWMMKPVNFDPGKKYPVIFYVYGEPAGSTVQNNWGGRRDLFHYYLAQQGYIVISVDNRGTKVPRGRAWRKSIYGQIGILATHDQAKAAKAIFDRYSYVDSSRVGMWGWSGGGQMTLNCLFKYPDIYHTGIALAFVSDQRLYDTIYQERYMGLPSENEEGYHDGSPINFAENLEGNLMIMHGTADDNVHYQSFEMLVDELIKHDKYFSMMSYPMRTHSISERPNTSLHLRKSMVRYWKNNLPAGGK
ncbi:S9 family peptidase [Halalkalibaculum sp. DA3122]|uniref:S9 family peptidase n=1 Tax=Halalkalibaculum sp. DA3122 TaxID=3373607 RepID=UPI00375509E7